jgi:hypothetical protein
MSESALFRLSRVWLTARIGDGALVCRAGRESDLFSIANPARETQWPSLMQLSTTRNSVVPIIDMAYFAAMPEVKRRVAAELDHACRDVGFYHIVCPISRCGR